MYLNDFELLLFFNVRKIVIYKFVDTKNMMVDLVLWLILYEKLFHPGLSSTTESIYFILEWNSV